MTVVPCRACGRPLRTPESVARRHGPTCWAREHPTIPAPRRARTPRVQPPASPLDVPVPHVPGQLALDLAEYASTSRP